MKITDRLAAIVNALPETAAVTLPVAELRQWVTDEEIAETKPAESTTADRWLTAEEVAKRLGTSKRYVYANRQKYPFTKELNGVVRFSERELERWMSREHRHY